MASFSRVEVHRDIGPRARVAEAPEGEADLGTLLVRAVEAALDVGLEARLSSVYVCRAESTTT